ncbi:hypothetical protein CCY99_03865 [Helicobacter sp. 16-1353]|uniref:metallophosphoesterase n=1 Tax=Helicobacter sp. 16-1353 TaxID=2004996 RepID=UPI000DCE03DB|nr:metallophosphoesterase [Helicobacter sp. 16-1353]RAX54494.1 hypothetical protein CCY99_03865 [Helicobacter sp. 16-1353]
MFIVILLLLAFAAWFVPFRLQSLLGFGSLYAWIGTIIIIALLALFPLLMRSAGDGESALIGVIYNIAAIFFMFFTYVFFAFLIEFILHPFLKQIIGWKIASVAILIPFFVTLYGFINAQNFSVTNIEIPLKNLKSPVTFMHISDIHLGTQRGEKYLQKIISLINEVKPDFVVYNGDLVDSNIALDENLFELFKNVKSKQIFTIGNHEYYIDTQKVLELLRKNNIEILRNESVEINGVQFIGLEYMNADLETADSHRVNDLTVKDELPKMEISNSLPTILAHHTPQGAKYVAENGIDVMISGHTHGGQVFPANIIAKFRFPFVKGIHKIGDTTLIISQGAGTFGPMLRIGTNNEIQIIRLIPS